MFICYKKNIKKKVKTKMGGSLSLIISYYIASHASRLLYVNYCTVVRDCFIDQNQATAQERAEC